MAIEEIIGGFIENAVGEVELRGAIKPDSKGWYRLRPGIGLWTGGALIQLGLIVCFVLFVFALSPSASLLIQAIIFALTMLFAAGSYWTWLACHRRLRWKGTELNLAPRLSPEISTTFFEVVRLNGPSGLLRWYVIEFADGQCYRFSSCLRGTSQFLGQLEACRSTADRRRRP